MEGLSKESWIDIWNTMATDSDQNANNIFGDPSLWVLMEKEFNLLNQKLIAQSLASITKGKVRIVLDDDKIHCDGNTSSPWHSLKRKKHVQSNR